MKKYEEKKVTNQWIGLGVTVVVKKRETII